MRWKAMVAAAFGCGLLAVVPALTFQGKTHNQAYASETVAPAAQPYNTVVRWTRETQKNNMGADIVMSQGYNLDGDTVVSILEDESPIITVSTYDETGNKVEVNSFDDGKQFVHSTYTYNEQGDQTSWVYQARTPEGVTETSYTYEYTYDGDDLTRKDSYQDGRLVSRETFTREQTDEGIVVRTVTDRDLVPDLTCYAPDGRPLWREKDTYRMVYYYDKLGRETENCVIANGMQQNRTLTVFDDTGTAIRRILYGKDINDIVSVSEIEVLSAPPQSWTDFAQKQTTTVRLAVSEQPQTTETETQPETQTTEPESETTELVTDDTQPAEEPSEQTTESTQEPTEPLVPPMETETVIEVPTPTP